jgi:hypothetical protein
VGGGLVTYVYTISDVTSITYSDLQFSAHG